MLPCMMLEYQLLRKIHRLLYRADTYTIYMYMRGDMKLNNAYDMRANYQVNNFDMNGLLEREPTFLQPLENRSCRWC